jgi:hypothetical protein
MPCRMSETVRVLDAARRLSPCRMGFDNSWASSWHILCWLLLGTDGAIVGWRRDERALDRPPRTTRFFGKSYFHGPPPASTYGHRPHRGRCVAIINGNGLTARSVPDSRRSALALNRLSVTSDLSPLLRAEQTWLRCLISAAIDPLHKGRPVIEDAIATFDVSFFGDPN